MRSVVTADVTSPGSYVASHELSMAQAENLVFGGIDESREPLPPNVLPPPGDTTNQYVVELEGSDPDRRVGTSLLLQVMAGDRFQVQSLAFYGDPEDEDENVYTDDNSMLNAIFTSFVNGFNPAYGEEGWGAYEQMGALFGNTGNMTAWNALKELETDPERPRAYLNYMVFDNNMELVQDQSGVIQVGATAGEWAALKLPMADIKVNQNGYLGVYLSNEQFRKVWFDNLWLVHYRGRLIEEHHYYPHGLTLGDVIAAGHEPNPYLYQGKKLQGEGGLKLYDFHARQYDPQIGRFWGIDPMDQFPSGYTGMGNDPANMVDPTGMWSNNPIGNYSGSSTTVTTDYTHPSSNLRIRKDDGSYEEWSILDGSSGGESGGGKGAFPGGDGTVAVSGGDLPSYVGSETVIVGAKGKTWAGRALATALDVLQTTLDVAGLVPGFGEFADGANALIYLARGDYANAALSTAAMVPFAGWGATSVKIGRRIASGFHKHHVIPKAVYGEFSADLKAMGFMRDAGSNLKRLPTPFHGNHPAYSERVRQGIYNLRETGNFNLQGMQELQHELRQEINNIYLNRGVERLNDYYKLMGY